MASSPTSSCHSSYSSPFVSSSSSSSPSFADLPVMALRTRIVEKIQENRITLIVGEAGCGKSSQVPQFLLEDNMTPILCTQPRRFAVVAVARMVAKARNCEVGGEVGYHIGHSRVFSERSKIVFKTAGVLLDEMRDKGLNALSYKVIILDEVHERSVESDLVLACLKQLLLKKKDLRVVLMSATADIAKYRDYFNDLGRYERVEVLAIPSSGQHIVFQRRISYLDKVTELLEMDSEQISLRYCSGESPSTTDTDISLEVQKLIYNLVLHIHKSEPDLEKSILVFLPTYYSLEQQWILLKAFRSSFKIFILHSSVDTQQALEAMKIFRSCRKVILATNIAESSVTIPQAAYVIDSCRSLQVFWDHDRKTDSSELVWVSKSQAEQRAGRTGRTCDGQVYRLVTESFFGQLQKYEGPAILRLSLRQQALLICCAESKSLNDPKVLLQKALDPPNPTVVEDALSFLVHMHALQRTYPRGRHEPTFYGKLLSSFSLSFDASVLVVKFGEMGMLREGIIIGSLMDTQPLPIVRPFGQESLFAEYIDHYFRGDGGRSRLTGRKEVEVMGNFCAFQFWQRVFNDKHRLEKLQQLLMSCGVQERQVSLPKIEEEWCSFHNLLHSSLHLVDETYEDVLSSFHRYRPKFFASTDGIPSYYDPYSFQHICCLKQKVVETDVNSGSAELASETRKCVTVPFVASCYFQTDRLAEMMATIVKEMRIHIMEHGSSGGLDSVNVSGCHVNEGEGPLCRFFMNGSCNRGSQCLFSHSMKAKTPICKFFFSLQGCRNGGSCFFSHDPGSCTPLSNGLSSCLPEDNYTDAASLLHLLPASTHGSILILDDVDFHYASHFSRYYNPSSIIASTSVACASINSPSPDNIKILWGVSHPEQTIISQTVENQIPWEEVLCMLWFPRFNGDDDYVEQVQSFFKHLAMRMLTDTHHEVQIILTMNNFRFAQMQVEKLGKDCFFFLRQSFPYDESSFGKLFDSTYSRKPVLISKPISYVFDFCPPSEVQFGDYTTALIQQLYCI